MSSSTSSFNFRRLARVVAICIALLIVYQIMIWLRLVPPSPSIHQWEDNMIRWERFADAPPGTYTVALTGTSLMGRIPAEQIGSKVINLGMLGGSPFVGIELVRRLPSTKAVVVEVSRKLGRRYDLSVVDKILGRSAFVRRRFSMFRQELQPVSVIVSLCKGHRASRPPNRKTRKNPAQLPDTRTDVGEVTNVAATYDKGWTPKEAQDFAAAADELRQVLLELRQQHSVRIIFAHIPADPAVDKTRGMKEMLDLMHASFPTNEWEWVPDPAPADWRANDGLHLTVPSAEIYADYLRSWLVAHGVAVE